MAEFPRTFTGADLDSALESAQRSGLPVAVVFGAVWCPACRRFQERTITAAEVRELGPSFHWVYVDIDRDVSLARDHEVAAVPCTVILRADGTRLAAAPGALRAPSHALAISIGGTVTSAASVSVTPGFANVIGASGNSRAPKKYRPMCMASAVTEAVHATVRLGRSNSTPARSGPTAATAMP